eukprot:scaffold99776_cov46-Tisochrysis_lutea.AAC.3
MAMAPTPGQPGDTNTIKALRAKWILNYLDARHAQWKQVLAAWFIWFIVLVLPHSATTLEAGY